MKKQPNKALDYMLKALASLQKGEADKAADALVQAGQADDLEDACDIVDTIQTACGETDLDEEATEEDLDNAVDKAEEVVASLSRRQRKQLLKKAVETASITEEEAEEVDINDEGDVVDALIGDKDPEEAIETLSDLDLIENAEDDEDLDDEDDSEEDAEDEEDDSEEDAEEEAKKALASVKARRQMKREIAAVLKKAKAKKPVTKKAKAKSRFAK